MSQSEKQVELITNEEMRVLFDLYSEKDTDKVYDRRLDLVLSEGECRIIALAQFLADASIQVDAEGNSFSTPIIFDDPISSLDYRFEQNVIDRLVELSFERQVIVFTHRLTLLSGLSESMDAILEKKNKNKTKEEELQRDDCFKEIEIVGRDGKKGIVLDSNFTTENPKDDLKNLIIAVKKTEENTEEGSDERENSMIGYKIRFRNIVEKSIEKELLHGVVSRFRRDIKTRNEKNLDALATIEQKDVDIIKKYMNKYSAPAHSVIGEAVSENVGLLEFKRDLLDFLTWINQYEKKDVPSSEINRLLKSLSDKVKEAKNNLKKGKGNPLVEEHIAQYRVVIEKTIQDILLFGVGSGHLKNDTNIKGSFDALLSIKSEDINEVYGQYDKYCVHHDEDEESGEDINFETLLEDIGKLKDWIERYKAEHTG